MRTIQTLSLLTAAFITVGASAQAAVLVGYNFTGGTVGFLTPASSLAPTSAPPTNVTATSISIAAGISGSTFQANIDNPGNIELNMIPSITSATTEAGAVTSNQYIEFTLNTPSASFELNLNSLQLDLRRGGTTGTRNLFLRTSLDSFATSISPGVVIAPAAYTLTTFTFADTPLYNNVLGPVTFRLYTFNNSGLFQSVRVDNLVVNGSVIPEPSAGLLLLSGLGMLMVMRRRK